MRPLRLEEGRLGRADGAELAYGSVGEGLPVVLANGLGASFRVWRHQIDYLSSRYRFTTWDYRGLFRSSPGGPADALGIREHARDGLAVMDRAQIEEAMVIGWSLGVPVALEMFRQARSRIRGLVLVGGAARRADQGGLAERLVGALVDPALRWMRKAPRLVGTLVHMGARSPEAYTWARRVGLLGRNVDPEEFAELAQDFEALDLQSYLAIWSELNVHDASDVLATVDVPVLIMAGDHDPFTSRAALESMAGLVPGAEYLIIPDSTHFVMLDQPEHVNLRIDKFLREHGYVARASDPHLQAPPKVLE